MKNTNLQRINSLILGNDLSGSVLLKSMLAEHGVKTKFCHTTGKKMEDTIEVEQPNVILLCLFDAAASFAQELMDKSAAVLEYEPVFILVEESHVAHAVPLGDREYENHLVIKTSLSKHDIYNALFRAVGYFNPEPGTGFHELSPVDITSKKNEGG